MANTDWMAKRLDEVAVIVGRGIAPKYADDGNFVVLNQRCVRDGRIDFALARRHDSKQRKVKEEKQLQLGDVVVNSTGVGTLGRTAPVTSLSETTTADSHLTILRPLPGIDPGWLRYTVSNAELEIEAMAEGSTGQTELSRHRLAELTLILPPFSVQKGIAHVLGSLDDKIESNHRQIDIANQLVDQLAIHWSIGVKWCPLSEIASQRKASVNPKNSPSQLSGGRGKDPATTLARQDDRFSTSAVLDAILTPI